jgi:integrase
MPTIKLTQPAVERLKPPPSGRVEYWDSQCPGFGLRVSAPAKGQEGRKTWQVLYRVKGKLVRETIGTLATYPNVAEARALARASLQMAQRGINPVEDRQRNKAEEERQRKDAEARARDTLGAAIDRYLEQYARHRMRPSYFKETKRALEIDVKAVLGSRPIRDLTRREIRDLLGAIVSRGRAPHASHVLAYMRAMLNWAVAEELIEANLASGVSDPDPRKRQDRERDRYLGDAEIRTFWLGCEQLSWPFGPLFQLLLLTGQRRDELAGASWSEIDLEQCIWTLPRERAKNDKAHLVHLSTLAMEIILALPRVNERLLFTTTGRTPVSGWGRARQRLAAEMGDPEPFTLHDVRRSTASGMAAIGVAHHVVDKVLNHSTGKISGVARIYNRHEYLDERRVAFEVWGRHVEGLIRPAPDKVIELAKVGR